MVLLDGAALIQPTTKKSISVHIKIGIGINAHFGAFTYDKLFFIRSKIAL